MFFPTGTLANHLAIRRHCGSRPRAVVQEQSHLYNDTGDSVSVLSGINLVPLGKGLPSFTVEELEAALEHAATGRVANSVGAVMVESPVRRQAGQTVPYGAMQAITDLCRDRGIPTHLDGARLFMMAAADGRAPAGYASLFDTVYVSLYKYFGAPFGGILAGTAEFMRDLYHDRRMFGSGLASSALIAGLALKGTEGFEERFAEAMARAADLFDRLNALPGIAIRPFEHGSNIFPMELSAGIDADALASSLAERSVFVYPENTWEGSTLLHVNTTLLRKSVDELFDAFGHALELASSDP
jgi:threonine aldolase